MLDDDISYYRLRAVTELDQAMRATCAEAARAHYEMANAYFRRVTSMEPDRQPQHA